MDHLWTRVDHPGGPPPDHPVRRVPDAAHISPMRPAPKTLAALFTAALIAAGSTGCTGPVITDQDRAAYESARFESGTPAAAEPLSAQVARARTSPALIVPPEVPDVTLPPMARWPAAAKSTLCEYTAKLINNAQQSGSTVPERLQASARRVLDKC